MPAPGDKSRLAKLHVQTRLAPQAIGLEGLRQRRGAGRPAPLLTFRPVGVGGERPAPSTSGPQCTGAPLVWRPARKGLRTAILGSCTETRPCSEPRPISEARAPKHIPRRRSSSAYIHYEPTKLIPAAQRRGSRARFGVRPSGSDAMCARADCAISFKRTRAPPTQRSSSDLFRGPSPPRGRSVGGEEQTAHKWCQTQRV